MDTFYQGVLAVLNTFGIVVLVTIMVSSWIGLVVPVFPGTVVMWVAMSVYGIVYGFGTTGWILFGLITLLMIFSTFIDNYFMSASAKEKGASWSSIFIAIMGGIVFSFLFPPIGGIIATPLLLFLAEFYRTKNKKTSFEVTKSMLKGWGWSFIARFGIGLIMLILWIIWFFSNKP